MGIREVAEEGEEGGGAGEEHGFIKLLYFAILAIQ